MANILGYNLAPNELKILVSIFKHRAMTTEQIYCSLYPGRHNILTLIEMESKKKKDLLTNVQRYTRTLRKEGLLLEDTIFPEGKGTYKYLSRTGYELVSTYLGIHIGKIGTGFNDDYADFSYELYKPPHKQFHHHKQLINLFLMIDYLKANFTHLDIDYRDNRYVSEAYPLLKAEKGKIKKKNIKKIRPDGEIRIGDKRFWVEIDTGTEWQPIIKEKFQGYAQYFNYLSANNKKVADGILFLNGTRRTEQSLRRWTTVSTAFFEGIGDWSSSVNLIFGSLADVNRIIERESKSNEEQISLLQESLEKIAYYLAVDEYKGTYIVVNNIVPKTKINYETVYSVTHTKDKHKAVVYERMDGYETIGLARIFELNKKLNLIDVEELKRVKEVVPILFFYGEDKPPQMYQESFNNQEIREMLSRGYWVNLKDNPTWYSMDGGKLEDINPFLSM